MTIKTTRVEVKTLKAGDQFVMGRDVRNVLSDAQERFDGRFDVYWRIPLQRTGCLTIDGTDTVQLVVPNA